MNKLTNFFNLIIFGLNILNILETDIYSRVIFFCLIVSVNNNTNFKCKYIKLIKELNK